MDERLGEMRVGAALRAIASRTPSPGGGAAVALSAAVAAALGEMVAAYAIGRKSNAAQRSAIDGHARALASAREALLALADDDARAYQALSDLLAQQKQGAADAQMVGRAARDAAAVPMAMIDVCAQVVQGLDGLGPSSGWLVSDLVASAAMIGAAARGAAGHVRANAPLMDAAGLGGAALVARALAAARDVAKQAEAIVEQV